MREGREAPGPCWWGRWASRLIGWAVGRGRKGGDGNLHRDWWKLLFGEEVKHRLRPNSAVCVRLALIFSLKPLQGSRLLSSTAHQIKHSLAVVYCVSLALQAHTLVTACLRDERRSPFMFCRNLLSVLPFSYFGDVQNDIVSNSTSHCIVWTASRPICLK